MAGILEIKLSTKEEKDDGKSAKVFGETYSGKRIRGQN
jgi:hypothetical protein